MKYFILQTVQLVGNGIPGVVVDRTPGLKGVVQFTEADYEVQFVVQFAEAAYEVQWVDGNDGVYLESELAPITGLTCHG